MAKLFYVLGALSGLYCLFIGMFVGHGTNFYLIWGVLGIVLILIGIAWKRKVFAKIPKWIRICLNIIVFLGMVVFLVVEGCILSGFNHNEEEELDFLIVLGAQLKESGPSKVLKMRLDKAYDYLVQYENTKVIVSGGQGNDEPDTEAQGMYQYLLGRGISAERIIKEDKSRSTVENVKFSSTFLDINNDKVGIVSNNFHIYRAVSLARHAGYEHVTGIPAPSEKIMLPHNMFREFFGVVKDFLVGNI